MFKVMINSRIYTLNLEQFLMLQKKKVKYSVIINNVSKSDYWINSLIKKINNKRSVL